MGETAEADEPWICMSKFLETKVTRSLLDVRNRPVCRDHSRAVAGSGCFSGAHKKTCRLRGYCCCGGEGW